MNGNPHEQHERRRAIPEPVDERPEPIKRTGTPDAVEAALVRRDDREHAPAGRRARGVEWVRPTDLIARHSAHAAGRGLGQAGDLRQFACAGARRLAQHAQNHQPVRIAHGFQQGGGFPGAGLQLFWCIHVF